LTTFSGAWYHRSKESWKSSPCDSVLHPKHTHIVRDTLLIISDQYGRKMFWSNIDNFVEPGDHRSMQSWKLGPDDSVLAPKTYPPYLGRISCRFSFVRVNMVSEKFSRLFRARALPKHEKMKKGPDNSV